VARAEATEGPDHPRVGGPLHGMAWLFQVQGRYAEAEAFYKRALAIKEKALGPDHPDVGGTVSNLAWLWLVQGDWARAMGDQTIIFETHSRVSARICWMPPHGFI